MKHHRDDPMQPESLLKHASWAHSLARSLVGEGAAEDLVQDAWVAALDSKPDQRRSLRPWLGTVLGNFARQSWRANAHRRQREQRGAKSEALPSAAELTERTESQRMLMDELLKLPESLREVLLLRYFEDLSAAQIGRQQGVPASTVKSRIERALEALREGLNEHFVGGRDTWALALLPLLRVRASQVIVPASSAFGLLTLLKLGLWLLVGTIGAAAMVVVGMQVLPALLFTEEIATEEVSFRALELAEENELQASSPTSMRTPIAQSPGVQTATMGGQNESTLRARFLDSLGLPVQGVQLHIKRPEGLSIPPSDGAGRIEFNLQHSKAQRSYSASYTHFALASDQVDFRTNAGATIDLGDIMVQPGGALRGRVTDDLGVPLINARVNVNGAPRIRREANGMTSSTYTTLGQVRTTTDEQGEFRLSGLLVGDVRVNVSADQELHQAKSGWVEIRAGQESSGLVIHAAAAPPEMRIEGHVLDPDGQPTYASVSASFGGFFGSGSMSRSANKEGFFRLALLQDSDHDLIITCPPGKNWVPILLPNTDPGSLGLRLQFSRSPFFQLLATDITGTPLEEYACTIRDRDEENVFESLRLGRVGPGGLELRLPEKGFVIQVRSPGYAERSYLMGAGQVDPGETFSMTLRRLPGVRGHVLHAGAPVAGAQVYLQRVAHQELTYNGFPVGFDSRMVSRALTGADGSFELELHEDGEYVVRAVATGLAPTESRAMHLFVERGIEKLKLKLSTGASIRGRVLSAAGRNSAQTIVAVSRGDCWAETQRVGTEGTYVFENLTPGPWLVKIVEEEIDESSFRSSSSFFSFSALELPFNCQTKEGAVTRYDLSLGDLPICKLKGSLKLTGIDMSRWRCELRPADLAHEQRGALQPSFAMEAGGSFELSVAGDGEWNLFLSTPDGDLSFATPITLSPGQNHWSRELQVAWVQFHGDAANAGYYRWGSASELSASLPLPRNSESKDRWHLVPAGPGQIHVFDPALFLAEQPALSLAQKIAPSDPSRWPVWKQIQLSSGERRALDLVP